MSAIQVLEAGCSRDDGSLCGWVYDVTGNERAGVAADALVGTPLRIVGIVLVALAVRFVVHRLLGRAAERIAEGSLAAGRFEDRLPAALASPLLSERRAQRARTIGSVSKSLTTGVVGAVAALTVMSELGYSLGPLLASAGIAGVALGFGAQTLVKDFLAGIFMLLEDQYGVGDVVDLGPASGSVEAVGLRVTRIRDVEGTVWYVRNGEVLRVGNRSQGWARAVLDVTIAYGEDVDRVRAILLDVAASARRDSAVGALMLEDPEVWGIEAVTSDGVVLRLVVRTRPLEQWTVARELRRLIKDRFDAEHVEVPYPQRTVWLRPDVTAPASPAPPAAASGRDAAGGKEPPPPAT